MFVPCCGFPLYMSVAANMVERVEGNERVPPLFQSWVPEGMLRNAIFSLIAGNITANVNKVLFITIFNLHFCIISFAGFSIKKNR